MDLRAQLRNVLRAVVASIVAFGVLGPSGSALGATGACCSGGACAVVDSTACMGAYLGDGTTCAPPSCQLGVCCSPTGACSLVIRTQCASGSAWVSGGVCNSRPCDVTGRCCTQALTCVNSSGVTCAAAGGVFVDNTTCTATPCTFATGACCRPSGCMIVAASLCTGSFLGVDTTCTTTACRAGACCSPTGQCSVVPQLACPSGSSWAIDDAGCQGRPCDITGRCCTAAGCTNSSSIVCTAAGGLFTEGVTCEASPCIVATGACCTPAGCAVTQASLCAGSFLGAGTACSTTVCTVGICCSPTNTCTLVPLLACPSPSAWVTNGTCASRPCAITGRCCTQDGACVNSSAVWCVSTGGVFTDSTTCSANPCVFATGACCSATTCTVKAQSLCTGQFTAVGVACTTTTCQQGVCCWNGLCRLTPQLTCLLMSGTWDGTNNACAPAPCPQVPTACCRPNGTCVLVLPTACIGAVQPGQIACPPTPACPNFDTNGVPCCRGTTCLVLPSAGDCVDLPGIHAVALGASCTGTTIAGCCYGDFNKSGAVLLDDVFAFLQSWFEQSPYAKMQGSGLASDTPGVNDIFQFLTAWFGGCN